MSIQHFMLNHNQLVLFWKKRNQSLTKSQPSTPYKKYHSLP